MERVAVSSSDCSPPLLPDEISHQRGERLGHLIWKWHHRAFDIPQNAPRDRLSDAGRGRIGMRIEAWGQNKRRATHRANARFHHIAIDGPVAFGSQRPGAQGIDHETAQKRRIANGIERLAPTPQLGQMGAIGAYVDVVDDLSVAMLFTSRGIDERTGRKNQSAHTLRRGGGDLQCDRRTGVMADNSSFNNAKFIEQGERCARPILDGHLSRRQALRCTEARRVHRGDAKRSSQQRQNIAILVPRTRRLVQQQNRVTFSSTSNVKSSRLCCNEGGLRSRRIYLARHLLAFRAHCSCLAFLT